MEFFLYGVAAGILLSIFIDLATTMTPKEAAQNLRAWWAALTQKDH